MAPLVERLKEETGVKVETREVWHSEANAMIMKQYDKGFCGGVPFFFNKKTGKWICGEADFDRLKQWALEETST
jgi:hypothetical protein